MNEITRVNQWLYTRLAAQAAITAVCSTRIYADSAPEGRAYPFVIFNVQAVTDTQGNGTRRILTRPLYQIKVITKGAPDAAAISVADSIDEVIGEAVREVLNGFQFSARREEPLSYREKDPISAQMFHHLGGLYRITVSEA